MTETTLFVRDLNTIPNAYVTVRKIVYDPIGEAGWQLATCTRCGQKLAVHSWNLYLRLENAEVTLDCSEQPRSNSSAGPMVEPPTGSTVLFCHPVTGQPEEAWYRDDPAATEAGYEPQHWYPLGRIMEDPPETWQFLTEDRFSGDRILVVTATRQITPGTTV